MAIVSYLEYSGQCKHKAAGNADEEHGCDVKEEGDSSIADQNTCPYSAKFIERSEAFGEWQKQKIDPRAYGRIIVQRNERVHFQIVQ